MWPPPAIYNPVNGSVYYASYDAYHGFVDRSQEQPRDPSNQGQQQSTTAEHPLIMPPSHPSGLTSAPGYSPSPNAPRSQSESLPQSTTQYALPLPPSQHSQPYQYHPGQFTDKNPQSLMRPPEQQFWPFHHPAMFPVPANAAVPNFHPPPFSAQQPIFGHPNPFELGPPGTIPVPPHAGMPPVVPASIQRHIPLPATQETRYKCEICGRYRSARYHYKHPIPAGQLPVKTICRKCQAEATDSDDDSSSDDVDLNRSHRHRPRPSSRSRTRSRRSASKRGPPARARRYSPQRDRPFDGYDEFSPSDSDSLISDDLHDRHRSGRYRRADTSRIDLSRRIHHLRLSPVDHAIYFDDDRITPRIAQRDGPAYHENDDIRSRRQSFPRSGSRERKALLLRHKSPDPSFLEHEPGSYQQNQERYGPDHSRPKTPASPVPRRHRSKIHPGDHEEEPGHLARGRSTQPDTLDVAGHFEQERMHENRRKPRPRSGRRGRSRTNMGHLGDAARSHQRQGVIHRSDRYSPQSFHSSSLGHGLAREGDIRDDGDALGRARNHRRPRSSSESVASEGLGMRAGDEIIVEQRHTINPTSSDDYHWYDEDGIRVRVREI